MAEVVIKVTSTAEAYWLAIDEHDIPVLNGRAVADLSPGPHTLVWWMLGNPGSGIDVTISERGDEIATASSRIPRGYTHGAGYLHFQVD